MKRAILVWVSLSVVIGMMACSGDKGTGPNPEATVTVENQILFQGDNYDIWEVYISPSESDSWGDNLLGEAELAYGKKRRFTIEPGVYDLRIVDEDLDAYTRYGIEINNAFVWAVSIEDIGFKLVVGGESVKNSE